MASNDVAILPLSTIQSYLTNIDLLPLLEQGFVAYAKGDVVVPPVGELLFDEPKGETHIKYGYIKKHPYYVIKIASGFYENPKLGIRSSQGLMLIFSQKTGELQAILLDEGYLTDVRTALASMITLKYLAPKQINGIGIIGTGIQAHLQLAFLQMVTPCNNIMVWGRNPAHAAAFQKDFEGIPFHLTIGHTIAELTDACNVLITTTPATTPLLEAHHIKKGMHITALGSDTAEKIELSPAILQHADIVVVDSLVQSQSRGEVFQARKNGCLSDAGLLELGHVLAHPELGRTNDHQVTIADLTGVAVQDIMIATAIFDYHKMLRQ